MANDTRTANKFTGEIFGTFLGVAVFAEFESSLLSLWFILAPRLCVAILHKILVYTTTNWSARLVYQLGETDSRFGPPPQSFAMRLRLEGVKKSKHTNFDFGL